MRLAPKITLSVLLPVLAVGAAWIVYAVGACQREVYQQSLAAARGVAESVIAVRSFVAAHQGVWVQSGLPGASAGEKSFYRLTPAQLQKELPLPPDVSLHITGTRLVNPANAPTAPERDALAAFATGRREAMTAATPDGKVVHLVLLFTKPECLPCHAAQGYRQGELRGVLSVSVETSRYRALARSHLYNHLVLAVALVVLAAFSLHLCVRRMVISPLRALEAYAVEAVQRQTEPLPLRLNTRDELQELACALYTLARRTQALGTAVVRLAGEKKAAQQASDELARLAYRDALTGLGNRHHLDLVLAEELARAQQNRVPLSVVLLDIDFFKRINDHYGHQAGDDVLRALAHLIRRNLRQGDTAARYGGEEFCLVLPGAGAADALATTERVREEVAAADFLAAARRLRITVSAGVAAFPEHGATPQELLAAADGALYAAKRAGRNRTVVAGEKETG